MSNWFKNMKGRNVLKIAAIVVAVCLVIAAVLALFDMWGVGGRRPVMITIPEGASLNDISTILKDEKIITYPGLFKLRVKLGNGYMFQMGGHLVDGSMSYNAILEKLTGTPDIVFDQSVKVLIPEGYEIRQIAETFEKMGLADSEAFIKETEKGEFDYWFINEIERRENRLEGYLFPATYEIMPGESEHEIIERMLKAFQDRVVPIYEQSNTECTLDEIVTMASLVEREAANDSERGTVASVFYNRLKKDMTLSSCASVQYIIKERKPILSNSDVKIKSPYNTYINKGLPPGPIASPGENSFKAALDPDDTDYLFFVARLDGRENVFSKTDTEHLENVRKIQGGR